MKELIVFFLILSFAVWGLAQESEEGTVSPIQALTETVSTSPHDLRAEAAELDIPQSRARRYAVEMRNVNREYQSGAITRTEYIGIKRQVIQRLK